MTQRLPCPTVPKEVLIHADGTRTVNCPKHGWTGAAGIGGWDDRCGECITEWLGQGMWTVKPYPKMKPLGIFFVEFDTRDLTERLSSGLKLNSFGGIDVQDREREVHREEGQVDSGRGPGLRLPGVDPE